jgi:methionine synthase II (cobalamin-independent)
MWEAFCGRKHCSQSGRKESNLINLRTSKIKKISTFLGILQIQRELGFEIFTDGELRRRNFMSNLTEAVAGFDVRRESVHNWDSSPTKPSVSDVTWVVNEKLR